MRSVFSVLLLINFYQFSFAQRLSPEEALEDIESLENNLIRYHAGLNRYTPADSIARYFDLVRSGLTKETDVVELYKEVTFLLSKVRCGHTRSSMPLEANDGFKTSQLFFPVSIAYLGQRLYIDDLLTNAGDLKRGEEILTINGLSIKEITRRIFEHQASDGFINTGKYRLTALYFRYYYQLYVAPDVDRYSLTIRGLDGKIRRVTVPGESYEQLSSLNKPLPEQAVLSLEHKADYSYMKIGTFVSYYLRNAGLNYEQFLAESFKTLNERGAKNLVLDLRGNGGGDDNYGALLVSYFANKPFRYFERIEVTDAYSGYGSVRKEGERNLMTSHKGLLLWQPEQNRFSGKVYVLTDGWSFSTCADVASVLHYNKWASFIGEETGGGYDGNTSGNSRTLTLAHSGIKVNIPMWMYTTANAGHHYHGRGVIPDYPVIPSPVEVVAGEDVVLRKAEELIRK